MTVEATVVIRLELDPAAQPIRGLVRDRFGNARRFSGWMQLMAAVDEARAAEAPANDQDNTQPVPQPEISGS